MTFPNVCKIWLDGVGGIVVNFLFVSRAEKA